MGQQMLPIEFYPDRFSLPWQQNLGQNGPYIQISPRFFHLKEARVENLAMRWCRSKYYSLPGFQVKRVVIEAAVAAAKQNLSFNK